MITTNALGYLQNHDCMACIKCGKPDNCHKTFDNGWTVDYCIDCIRNARQSTTKPELYRKLIEVDEYIEYRPPINNKKEFKEIKREKK